MKITQVSASILPINWSDNTELIKSINILEKANVNMIHLDVMDGKFVPKKTFDEKLVDFLKSKTYKLLDVHLMVENPESVIDKYIKAGADILTVHYEACNDLEGTLKRIKSKNVLSGVAISPKTPAIKLKDILKTGLVDVVIVMGVEPGDYGRTFIPGSAEKVAEIRDIDKEVYITIDGGVTLQNAKLLRTCGANIIVSGSTIFNAKNMKKTVKVLKGRYFVHGLDRYLAINETNN